MGSLSGMVTFKREGVHSSFIFKTHLLSILYEITLCMEAAGYYLQPVMKTDWALLCVHALNVEVFSEVKRDNEARFYRNDVLAGHSIRRGLRVSWTEQMSLWLIKYTTTTGY